MAYEKALQTWRSGLLDSKFLPEVQATRPDFKLKDLLRSAVQRGGWKPLPLNFAQDDEAAEQTCSLVALARVLKFGAGGHEGSRGGCPAPPKPQTGCRARVLAEDH